MNQYEKYLDDVVNDTYKYIKPLVEEIRNVGVCPSCGGIFLLDNCLYCRTESSILKEVVPKLIQYVDRLYDVISNLPKEGVKVNKLFNLLYSLTNIKIDSIDTLLDKFNYEKIYNEYEKDVISKLGKNFKFTKLDIDVLETSVLRNENASKLFSLLTKELIDKNETISYESFRKLTENYILAEMEKFCLSPKCIIIPIEEITQKYKDRIVVAQASINRIYISEEEIKLLYYKSSNSLVNSIFHELKHIEQFTKFYLMQNFHPFIIEEIKEHILTIYVPGYYEENYRNISYEIEAEYYALIRTRDFFEELEYSLNKDSFDRELNSLNVRLNDKRRFLNGEEVSMDELFDKTILNHPELLDRYKEISLLYKIEDNLVYPKSSDELIEDYMKIVNDPKYDVDEKERYKSFYNYYVSKVRK